MKRKHYIALLIVLAGMALGAKCLLWPRQLPPEACSDVYRHYRNTPGIKAAFLKDYPLDDSTTIDVTMLQASDSATWEETLMQIHNLDKKSGFLPLKVSFKLIPKHDSKSGTENNRIEDNDFLASNFNDLTIAIFHLENEHQYDAIIDYYIKQLYL